MNKNEFDLFLKKNNKRKGIKLKAGRGIKKR